jgi:ketopantoate reductase
MDRATIKRILLENGFHERLQERGLLENVYDLNPYVYTAVEMVLEAAAQEGIEVPMAVGVRIYDVGTPKQKILDAAQQRCEMIVRTQQSIEASHNAKMLRDREWKRNTEGEDS